MNSRFFTGIPLFSFLAKIVRKANDAAFKVLVLFVVRVFPSSYWYKTALLISYFSKFKIARIVVKKESLSYLRARDLNKLLALFTRSGEGFPVDYQLTQLPTIDHEKGLILCTVHLPLAKVAIRAFMDKNYTIDAAIVGQSTKNNYMAVCGIITKIPALLKGPFVLLKVKNILSKNGRVVLMIDNGHAQGVYSPNIMYLCGKVDAKIVFFFAELKPTGVIETNYIYPPNPFCKTEEEINENLVFLRTKANEIYRAYNYTKIVS